MTDLIVITGDLAALKTTVCRMLQDTHDLPAIIKDDLKETLYEQAHTRDETYLRTLSDVTFETMVTQAKAQPSVTLFEGNFKPHEVDVIQTQFSRALWFFLTADAQVRYTRYLAREPQRHPAHRRYGTLSYEAFLRASRTPEPFMHIVDTTQMDAHVLESMNTAIQTFLTTAQ